MNVRVNAARSRNQAFTGNGLGAGADNDGYARLNIGIARLADADDAPVLDPDVGLDDAPVIHDQRIGNHGIHRALGLRTLRLAHAVADHLAAAEFHFLAVNGVVALDFDPQIGVAQSHPVANSRAVHIRIGAVINPAHGAVSSSPITSPRKP